MYQQKKNLINADNTNHGNDKNLNIYTKYLKVGEIKLDSITLNHISKITNNTIHQKSS